MASQAPFRVGYITDIEGNLNFLNRYVEISEVVDYDEQGELLLRDNSMFVFGGDVCDKGPHDMKVAGLLSRLKQRYPDRVALLLGNRDVNKMRLTAELAESELARPLNETWSPSWISEEKENTLKQFLEKVAAEQGKAVADVNTRVNRLRWIFSCTMGNEGTMELRRAELAELRGVPKASVGDDEVMQSYVESVSEGGFLREYLQHGQLAQVVGNALFVHGCVPREAAGFVPGPGAHGDGGEVVDDVREWAAKLNAWSRTQYEDWCRRPCWTPPNCEERGGALLIEYGQHDGLRGRNVIYGDWLVDGNAAPIDPEVAEYLDRSGINVVLSGHKPHGDCPTPIRRNAPPCVTVVTADTSYSNPDAEDNRGAAVNEVLLEGPSAAGPLSVRVHGILAGGQRVAYVLDQDGWLGRACHDGFWVKAKLEDATAPQPYLICKGEGFTLHQRWVSEAELQSLALETERGPQ